MGYSKPYLGDPMSPQQVRKSVELGNRIARQLLQNNPKPSANAAIRHMRATSGTRDAIALAMSLLNMSERDAVDLVNHLEATKANDIVTPHWEK